jgi:anion transporter
MKTIKGPALFLAQFAGDEAPFNSWDSITKWAADTGYAGVQVPSWDARLIDLDKAASSKDYCDEFAGKARENGVEVTELSTHLQGQLVAVHPAYDEGFDGFTVPAMRGNPKARQEWAVEQVKKALTASKHLGIGAMASFSGALAWPYMYPWPQRPAGLIETAFDELARRWKPILDHADECGVDICYEIHPGEDLFDGTTFEMFLERVGLLEDDTGEAKSKFPLALLLGVAYAASIGGVATLIGTPPNALLAGALNQTYGYDIGFGRWMIIGVPVAVLMLLAAWLFLTKLTIRLDKGEVAGAAELFRSEIAKLGAWSVPEKRVAIVFVVTAFAWVFRTILDDYIPGLNDTSIAILAALVLFVLPAGDGKGGALIEWKHALRLPWGVLVLFGGGLSLAAAVVSTGLDQWIGGQVGTIAGVLPLIGIVVLVSGVILLLTEFTSNTATAATFLPLVAALAISLGENPLMLAVPAALAASMAFMLPVATPPNALVFGSGHVTIPQMATQGIWLNLAAIVVISTLGYAVLTTFFGVEVGSIPDWAARAE